jgi:hypothetical protein
MTARIYRLERSGAINPARSGMAPDSAFDRLMSQHAPAALGAGRDVAGDGVQAHSKGDLYPCIIGVIERGGDASTRSYELTYRGRSAEYATWEDAASVARALLAGVLTAEAWNGRAPS